MPEFKVNIPVEQLCVLVRHEAGGDDVNFLVDGKKEYLVAELDDDIDEFPQRKALVKGTLSVKPLTQKNYWVLRLEATRDLGPATPGDDSTAPEADLDFEEEFLAADTRKTALLTAQTEDARRAFEEWLRDAALHTEDMLPLTIPLYRSS